MLTIATDVPFEVAKVMGIVMTARIRVDDRIIPRIHEEAKSWFKRKYTQDASEGGPGVLQ